MRVNLRPQSSDGWRARWTQIAKLVGVPVLLAAIVTAGAPSWTTYHIKRGDTVTEIAARYRVSVAQLVEVNRLPGNGNLIYAGRTLKVPVRKPAKHVAKQRAAGPAMRTVVIRHRVVLGDTLTGISRKYDVPTARIRAANRLPSTVVQLGTTLRVPVRKPVAPPKRAVRKAGRHNSFAGRVYPDAVVKAAARNRAILAKRAHPSRAETRRMITRTARALGVDPELALAVAWNESGWNQRRVSVANAIGVMQVLPSTGRWISSVVGRDLNLLKARDNIVAGVTLLRVLTQAAKLDHAVAGYYQGLGSVKRNGMFRDTKRYVATVLAIKKRFERR
jgi:LysM repeat protein